MKDVAAFDRFARLYERAMPAADRDHLTEGFRFADREVERVLDLAGGTGRAGRTLDGEVVVLDAARGMLRRASQHGLVAVQGDAARLPACDESVDAVVVVDALHHVYDAVAAVDEIRRVIRPGGVVVVREFDPTTLRGRALAAAEHAFGFESRFRSPDALAAVLERAGMTTFVPDRGFAYTVVGVR